MGIDLGLTTVKDTDNNWYKYLKTHSIDWPDLDLQAHVI